MSSLDRPKLRPLSTSRFEYQGRSYVLIQDPSGAFTNQVLVPLELFIQVCRHFEGELSLEEIRDRVHAETGSPLPRQVLEQLVAELDSAMILDGPTFASYRESYRSAASRPPALAGRSYAAGEEGLRQQLGRYFGAAGGAGRPALCPPEPEPRARGRIRGVLTPHIDFNRGGPVYTWSYKELAEDAAIDTFVILGVAHQFCRRRFALTFKDFSTPLGSVPTDREYVDQLARLAGPELFDDELVHKAEHSIEFQVVFLQYVLGKERHFSIVPILVGSFHDLMERNIAPIDDPEVSRFVDALRRAELASGKNVAYIGGIDLCHVGPEFGDPAPVDSQLQETVRRFDGEMLSHAAAGDPESWFQTASTISNRWRVCGLAATYTLLHAIGPAEGRLLKYDQALDPLRTCCVSFASMVFHAPATTTPSEHPATNGTTIGS